MLNLDAAHALEKSPMYATVLLFKRLNIGSSVFEMVHGMPDMAFY